MENKIKRLLTRLENNKNIDDLKTKLSTFCRILVESFNLEKCLVLFHEANPILDRFAVAFPVSEVEYDDDDQIICIEGELLDKKDPVTVFPIMYKTKKIGAVLLVPKKESIIGDSDKKTLKNIAGKCAEAIGKLVVFQGTQLLIETTRELEIYKKKVGLGFEKDNDIIFYLSMGIVVPTRVYIACQIEDNSYVYSHLLAADGIIEEKTHGTLKAGSFEFMIKEVREDEPGITEIEIKHQGKVKGMLMVAYERSDSVYHEEIEKILLVLSPNLASLMILNRQGE